MDKVQFDARHDAALLRAAGYTHEFVPAEWMNTGGPESGPHFVGHASMHVWSLEREHSIHYISVVDGEIDFAGDEPKGPPGWENEY